MLIQPTTPKPGSSQADGPPVACGSFWPTIDPATVRQTMRLDGTVTPQRLRAALIEACASVGVQLAAWRRGQQAAGFATLTAVCAEEIDGASVLVQRWQRAVQCTAAANLTERYLGFDSTAAGQLHADALAPAIEDLHRDARWAISDIRGESRSTIELI